jgi:hypothetical protein
MPSWFKNSSGESHAESPPASLRIALAVYSFISLEVVSQPRITPEGKAQSDSKAQHTRQYVSISRGLQRRHRGSDGVMKPLLVSWDDDLAFAIRPNVVAGTMPNKAPTQKTQPLFKVSTLHEFSIHR